MTPSTTHAIARRGVRAAALAAVAALGTAACSDTVDRLLDAQTPSRLAEETFLVPQNAPLIVGSAQADFECALGAYVVASGLAAGELTDVSQTASRWSYDRRNVLPLDAHYSTFGCTAVGVYTPISTARYTTDQALTRLEGWTDAEVPNRNQLMARAALYAGYSYVLLAEGFCTAAVNLGPELTTTQLLDSAEARFSRTIALATAPADSSLLRAAYVGRARARLGRGNAAGAATDAAQVPTSFVLLTTADNNASRRQNRVFDQNNNTTAGVTVAEAFRTLTVAGQPDPRVRVTNENRLGSDQFNPLFRQTKYASLTAGIPIASGVEARLIEAEARGAAQGVAIINALRARAGVALPALTAAETASFQATVYSERSRELFLQGNRWFDVRRGNLALVPASGVQYAKGGTYGDQRCWPLPDVERAANPNLGARTS
jgi:hypothetical protein